MNAFGMHPGDHKISEYLTKTCAVTEDLCSDDQNPYQITPHCIYTRRKIKEMERIPLTNPSRI